MCDTSNTFGAGYYLHIVLVAHIIHDVLTHGFYLLCIEIKDFQSINLAHALQNKVIIVHEADDQPPGKMPQLVPHFSQLVQMVPHRGQVAYDDRIVSPNYSIGSNEIGEFIESIKPIFKRTHPRFQHLRIVVECKKEVIIILDLIQPG